MFRKHWQFMVVLVVLAVMATVFILFAPIIPVESTIPQTGTMPLRYSAQDYSQPGVPRFVNVTNTDFVGGVFSVTLQLSEGEGVVGGVEFTIKETTTLSRFIDAGATEKFSSPEEWVPLESKYTFFYRVAAPEIQDNYNITRIENKSLISIIANP